jgi:Co/Zn/Cd efflux system component
VLANVAVFISGAIVLLAGYAVVDLVVGFAIGLYVLKKPLKSCEKRTRLPEMGRPSA